MRPTTTREKSKIISEMRYNPKFLSKPTFLSLVTTATCSTSVQWLPSLGVLARRGIAFVDSRSVGEAAVLFGRCLCSPPCHLGDWSQVITNAIHVLSTQKPWKPTPPLPVLQRTWCMCSVWLFNWSHLTPLPFRPGVTSTASWGTRSLSRSTRISRVATVLWQR